jgi:hypothetical protein
MRTFVASRRFAHSVVLAILVAVSVPVSAERKILQNDSFTGTATFTQLAAFAEQEYAAAVFTADPADYPFQIVKVQALILAPLPGTIALVSVTVWEDMGTAEPGSILSNSTYGYQVESSEVAVNELELSCENVVVMDGSIRVGLRWEAVGDPIGIAFDLDGYLPMVNTVYSSDIGGWWFAEDLGVTGDWILRIEIETNVTGETVFSDSFERGDQSCWE